MNRTSLYTLFKERKVIIAVIIGLLFLLLALAITRDYFGIRDFENSKLIHFAENLANGLEDRESLEQWLTGKQDSLENTIKDEIEQKKLSAIQIIIKYLETHVPWWKVWLTIISFIATCLFIFEFFRSKFAQIFGEERAPFSWKLNTDIISRFRNLDSWKPILEYFGQEFTDWTNNKITKAKEEIRKFTEEETSNIISDFKGFIDDDLARADTGNTDFEKIFSARINSELSKGSLLLLIDQVSSNDHFAQFWQLAVKAFRSNGIPADSYFFNGDPRLCFSESHEQGISLAGLAGLHPDSILIVIGDGGMMIRSDECQLRSWTSAFQKWESRFLFTPRNYFTWGKRENLLKELFHVFPAKFSSLKYLGPKANKQGAVDFQIEKHAQEHVIDYEQDVINELTLPKYFGHAPSPTTEAGEEKEKKTNAQPLLDWISSCAFHKNLDFQLSLQLGKANFDRVEGAAFTPEVILSVFQLPWFRTGKIEDTTRVAIAKKFEEESTDTAGYIRKFLKMKLPKWKPAKDSLAGDEVSETEQINESKITDPQPDQTTKQKFKKELNKIYDRGIEPDRILAVTDGIHNQYSRYFHPRLRPLIFNHGYSGLGLSRRFKNILYSLLAGLLFFLIFCIIIWLSRPLTGGCPECPPTKFSCAPINKMIGATQDHHKKIILTGDVNKPKLAYLNGFNDDCCVPIKIVGSGAHLMIGQDTISWTSDSTADIQQLMQGETLRMEIKDRVEITVRDSVSLTVFASFFDTVRVQVININKETRVDEVNSAYIVRFYDPDMICPTLTSEPTKSQIFRTDTIFAGTLSDTSSYEYVVMCPEPNSILIDTIGKKTLVIYHCGSTHTHGSIDTIYKYIRDTVPCDSIKIEIVREPVNQIQCPEVSLNLSCVGEDILKLRQKPTLYLNEKLLIGPPNFTNPIKLPQDLTKNHKLTFRLKPPYRFISGDSVLVTWFDPKQSEIGLDIFTSPNQDTTLQVSGDIIVLNSTSTGLKRLQISDDSLELWHCNFGQFVEVIEHTNGIFCSNIKNFSFCDSQIVVKWKGFFYGYKLLRDYDNLRRCSNDVLCADFGSIVIRLDRGRSSMLENCCEDGPVSEEHN